MKIGFISLGCPKNQVDSEIMIARLKAGGHRIVNDKNKAEIIIINTCGFIDSAREEAVDTIIECGELKKNGLLQHLIAVGCLPQICGSELLEEIPELDGVAGISAIRDIDKIVAEVQRGQRSIRSGDASSVPLEYLPRTLISQTGSAYLKIADGCDNVCSYCLIPSIRGRYRSKPPTDIFKEAAGLVQGGVRELVLIAQDSGLYGADLETPSDLEQIILGLSELDQLRWVRLMYLHPDHVSDRIMELIGQESKAVPYIEIPVQHASERVLRAMNRHYTNDELVSLFGRMRSKIPDLAIRTTLMVGFPGESDQDFEILKDFVQEVAFDWLGVFIYEAQDGTPAAAFSDIVPDQVAQYRRDEIMRLQQKITRSKNQARIGRTEDILIEKRVSSQLYLGRGFWQAPEIDGLTMVKSDSKLEIGQMVRTLLKGIRNYDMIGEYCQ